MAKMRRRKKIRDKWDQISYSMNNQIPLISKIIRSDRVVISFKKRRTIRSCFAGVKEQGKTRKNEPKKEQIAHTICSFLARRKGRRSTEWAQKLNL